MLHETLLVLPQGRYLRFLRRNAFIKRGQTVSNFLLFREGWCIYYDIIKKILTHTYYTSSSSTIFNHFCDNIHIKK